MRPGLYAARVIGRPPRDVLRKLKEKGVPYVPRDDVAGENAQNQEDDSAEEDEDDYEDDGMVVDDAEDGEEDEEEDTVSLFSRKRVSLVGWNLVFSLM